MKKHAMPPATVASATRDPGSSRLMLDHPGWLIAPDGRASRAFRSGDAVWMTACDRVTAMSDLQVGCQVEIVQPAPTVIDPRPVIDGFDPSTLPASFRAVPLIRDGGPVHRVRNPDLWDAILIPLIRYLGRTAEAGVTYRKFCSLYGERVETPLGAAQLTPTASTVAHLSDDQFAAAGVRRPAAAMRASAAAYLARASEWDRYPTDALFHALLTIPNIGSRSAAAIVADRSNDFTFHRFIDFATPGIWEHFTSELGEHFSMSTFERAWETFAPHQVSTLAALSFDWKVRNGEKRHVAITRMST